MIPFGEPVDIRLKNIVGTFNQQCFFVLLGIVIGGFLWSDVIVK